MIYKSLIIEGTDTRVSDTWPVVGYNNAYAIFDWIGLLCKRILLELCSCGFYNLHSSHPILGVALVN